MIDQSKKIFPVDHRLGQGMTLLEYYTGQALVGLLANPPENLSANVDGFSWLPWLGPWQNR